MAKRRVVTVVNHQTVQQFNNIRNWAFQTPDDFTYTAEVTLYASSGRNCSARGSGSGQAYRRACRDWRGENPNPLD